MILVWLASSPPAHLCSWTPQISTLLRISVSTTWLLLLLRVPIFHVAALNFVVCSLDLPRRPDPASRTRESAKPVTPLVAMWQPAPPITELVIRLAIDLDPYLLSRLSWLSLNLTHNGETRNRRSRTQAGCLAVVHTVEDHPCSHYDVCTRSIGLLMTATGVPCHPGYGSVLFNPIAGGLFMGTRACPHV